MRENAGKMWTRIIPNTDTFCGVRVSYFSLPGDDDKDLGEIFAKKSKYVYFEFFEHHKFEYFSQTLWHIEVCGKIQ